jgi:hypothetical protein
VPLKHCPLVRFLVFYPSPCIYLGGVDQFGATASLIRSVYLQRKLLAGRYHVPRKERPAQRSKVDLTGSTSPEVGKKMPGVHRGSQYGDSTSAESVSRHHSNMHPFPFCLGAPETCICSRRRVAPPAGNSAWSTFLHVFFFSLSSFIEMSLFDCNCFRGLTVQADPWGSKDKSSPRH